MRGSLPSSSLTGLAGLVESYGHNADSIAEHVGLDTAALYRPDLTIGDQVFGNMLEETASVCEDRFFTLKLAQLQGWDVLGPIWLLIRNANTVGEALQIIVDHLELYSEAISAYLVKDPAGVSFCSGVRLVAAPTKKCTAQVEFRLLSWASPSAAMSCVDCWGIAGDPIMFNFGTRHPM
jgi:hypothetical protein